MRHGQASLAQKRKGKKGVRGLAGQRGAFGGRDLGDIPARWAGGGDAHLSSDVSRRRSRISIDSGFPGCRRRIGTCDRGRAPAQKVYGVSSLPFLVVGCHVVADGRRVSGLRLQEEMGRQRARERYAGPRSGWVEGSGMCWRAFKCGGPGRERRCDVLTVLLAGEGAGRGQGVLTMHGGAGSGGRREPPLVSHVFGKN